MGKFEIKQDKLSKYRFNLKANNGQVILSSEAFNSKAACENGIESVRKNCQDDEKFERKTAKDGSPYFNLKASNGQVIGASEMYSSTAAMENGIASVKKNAPDAPVDDKGSILMDEMGVWQQNSTTDCKIHVFCAPEIPLPTVEVAYEEYEKFLRDSAILQALMEGGVEHWQGYEKAIDNINKIGF